MKLKNILFLGLLGLIMTSMSSCFFLTIGIAGALATDPYNDNRLALYGFPYRQTSKEYKDLYTNQLENKSKVLRTWYHYTVELVDDRDFILKKYYPDTKQMTDYYTYSDESLLTKHGVCKEWWDNGKKKLEGQYDFNQRTGEWSFYHVKTGLKSKKGYFRKNVKEGKWHFYYPNSGKLKAEINFSNDERNGPFKLFNTDEKLVAKGMYFQGQVENITWNTEDSAKYAYFLEQDKKGMANLNIQRMPAYPECDDLEFEQSRIKCTDNKLTAELYRRIVYPSLAREKGIEGETYVGFVVDTEGKVTDVKVHRGICKEIKTELERIFEDMPTWKPGTANGEEVDIQYYIPVRFRLQSNNFNPPSNDES